MRAEPSPDAAESGAALHILLVTRISRTERNQRTGGVALEDQIGSVWQVVMMTAVTVSQVI